MRRKNHGGPARWAHTHWGVEVRGPVCQSDSPPGSGEDPCGHQLWGHPPRGLSRSGGQHHNYRGDCKGTWHLSTTPMCTHVVMMITFLQDKEREEKSPLVAVSVETILAAQRAEQE